MTAQTRGRYRMPTRHLFINWLTIAMVAASWVVIIGTPVLVWSVLS